MSERRERLRLLALGAVALIALVLGLTLYLTDALREAELDTVDARFSLRGDQEPPDDLVVVGIDDLTFQELDLRFPFPRSVFAKALDRVSADKPTAIGYDIQFTEPTKVVKGVPPALSFTSSKEDFALINAVKRADNVVLSTTEVGENGETAVLGGDLVLKELDARAANGNFIPDPGGVLRRLPYSVDGLTSFAVATAEEATGEKVDPDKFDEETLIDFSGPPTTIETVSFSTVLNGETEPGFFKDKIVVIGPTAPSIQDVHPTATTGDDLMPGPEVQANAIQTVREGLPLQGSSGILDLLLIVLMSVAPPLVSLRLGAIRALIIGIALGLLYGLVVEIAFISGVVLEFVYPMLSLAVAVVGMIAVQYLLTAFERERVRSVFARFVPEGVVGEVMARTDEDLRLGGERRECTILFSDIRGFTTFSESRDAGEVVEILNHYLELMSDAIMAHGGAITAYIGDGIMAVFGAPIEQPDHADRALAAGREMLEEKLPAFNSWAESEKGIEPFGMGVGIHSGPVMVGNVGSNQRLEYTAIGDTVNTAARLEGMTKYADHSLFVADSTRELLSDGQGSLVYVDELEVRGRKSKIKIWAPATVHERPPSPAAEA